MNQMEKQRVNISGVSTSVTIREGIEPAIICVHGNSMNQQIFNSLWDNPDFSDRALVTFDLPGHGDSGLPPKPEADFSFSGYGKFLIDLIDFLKIENYIIMGHSLGGHIVLHTIAEFGLPSLAGLFLLGTPPLKSLEDVGRAFTEFPPEATLFSDLLNSDGAGILAAAFTKDQTCQQELKETILSTAFEARHYMGLNVGAFGIRNEQDVIDNLTVPVRIVFGKDDPAINHAYLEDPFFSQPGSLKSVKHLPETDHVQFWDNSSQIAAELKSFLDTHYA